ncbi:MULTISPECIES: sigma-70 family RNA polymerase sigma factor [unclassified Halomonas]|uniref:sigma-70 family RNA polymerase sigma factor n=1 Tax=unclassified Halomonas TaxID=2609666 RepID=UPI0009906CCC|nr:MULTISPECIES: sigma-70 family RNA polymerase sigma factor [unclassified Halomonas]AQU83914.1 RNA polymerase subunit sigma [Halomonas sp. 'Soap Lake \
MPTNDSDRLHCLYREHHSWLKSWLVGRLGSASDAADLAHDTFIRLMVTQGATDVRQPRAYLRTIARGLVVDRYRRQTIERAYLEALALRPEPVAISPEERLQIMETLALVDTTLHQLGDRTRRIFLAVQLEGLSYGATAEHIGVSITTVKKHLIRAMTQCLLLMEE